MKNLNEVRGFFVALREPLSIHEASKIASNIRALNPRVGDVAFDREALPDVTMRQEQALVNRVGAFLEELGTAAHENHEYGELMPKHLELGVGLRSHEMAELARDLLDQLGIVGVPEMPWSMHCPTCNVQATCNDAGLFKSSFRFLRAEHLDHAGFSEWQNERRD